ncbi:Aldo/keto reductase [Xylariaceae sp. FL0594]|nr:Aldo/keto reductase [Xylariaceae sp. FL0594]
MPSHPQLIFGGASLGDAFATADEVSAVLETLKSAGISRVDTAARYPPTSPNASERLLGETGAASKGFSIDTKVFCPNTPEGHLAPDRIQASIKDSYGRLKLGDKKLNTLYCHRPDPTTPLEEQARALHEQHEAGLFDKLGVSNFDSQLLERYMAICEEKGYVKPTVYQGMYNLVTRGIEKTLFPTLRKYNMSFVAYSPLAGGFLNGKLSSGDTQGTRFEAGNAMGQGYRMMFDKKEMHEAIEFLNNTLESKGVSKVEASLRWIAYHSQLRETDGIILGASKVQQIIQNAQAIGQGPLDESIVDAIEEMWKRMPGA